MILDFNIDNFIKHLIKMISKIISRGIIPVARFAIPAVGLIRTPKFDFGKIQKASQLRKILDDEIKAEQENITDLGEYQKQFKKGGWTISRENTLVELSKSTGTYEIRLLSNIKSPTQFDEEQNKQNQQQPKEEEDFNGDMNEVSICVTKIGSQKTMVVNTIVTEGFQITNINFAQNYKDARAHRLDIFNSNQYSGPEMETLSDQLFESIYGFLEEELGITNQTMTAMTDYCLDGEQGFYIEWLKDLKAIV